jgi:hypothetical protein
VSNCVPDQYIFIWFFFSNTQQKTGIPTCSIRRLVTFDEVMSECVPKLMQPRNSLLLCRHKSSRVKFPLDLETASSPPFLTFNGEKAKLTQDIGATIPYIHGSKGKRHYKYDPCFSLSQSMKM